MNAHSHRQQGSIAIVVAGALVLAMALLGSVQVGYLAYMKRDLQKMVDMAALGGAQALGVGDATGCTAAIQAAAWHASENFPSAADSAAVECGVWDADAKAFRLPQPAQAADAVRVYASHPVEAIVPFLGKSMVGVEAVARAMPGKVAVFSVGPRLLEFDNNGVVGGVLAGLGVDVTSLTVLSDRGVLDTKVTLGGLLRALAVSDSSMAQAMGADLTLGDLNRLLDTHVALGDVLNAMLVASGQEDLLYLSADVISALQAKLPATGPMLVHLGGGEGAGLFGIVDASASQDGSAKAALDAEITLLDLLSTTLGVATGGHAFALGAELLGGPLRVGVVEPPSIGIGGPGTTAYSAQVRAYARLRQPVPLPLGALSLDVDLPLALDLVRGQATLGRMCEEEDSSGRPLASIQADVSVLGLCVGDIDEDSIFSRLQSCDVGLQPKTLLEVRLPLLNTTLLNLNTQLSYAALNGSGVSDFHAGQVRHMPEGGVALNLDQVLSDLIRSLFDTLMLRSVDAGTRGGQGVPDAAEVSGMVTAIWDRNRTAMDCNPYESGSDGYKCRKDIQERALDEIRGQIGSLSDTYKGLLPGLSGVVKTLGTVVGNLVSNLLNALFGTHPCAGVSVLGFSYSGTVEGCQKELADLLTKNVTYNSGGGGNISVPYSAFFLLGSLLDGLRPLLNGLQSAVLQPLLNDVVGLSINRAEVRLISLDCSPGEVRLVR